MYVMATFFAAAWVYGKARGGKDVLPDPFAAGTGGLYVKSVGQVDAAVSILQILFVE